MSQDRSIAVYDWGAGPEFLLYKVFPESVSIPARLPSSPNAREVLRSAGDACRFFFFHFNLTRTRGLIPDRDELVAALQSRRVQVFNAYPADISKRNLHHACSRIGLPTTLASREGDPSERVIVKTDLNYGGVLEMGLPAPVRAQLGLAPPSAVVARLRAEVMSRWRGMENMYPVMERREAANDVWTEPQLVVERYIENHERQFCRVHFLSDYISIIEAQCDAEIKKLPWSGAWTHYEYIGDTLVSSSGMSPRVSEALVRHSLRLRRELRMEYGAFDVVFNDDGEYYFIDVNATPYWGSDKPNPVCTHLRSALAPGAVVASATR